MNRAVLVSAGGEITYSNIYHDELDEYDGFILKEEDRYYLIVYQDQDKELIDSFVVRENIFFKPMIPQSMHHRLSEMLYDDVIVFRIHINTETNDYQPIDTDIQEVLDLYANRAKPCKSICIIL